jgi:hypothetical protein
VKPEIKQRWIAALRSGDYQQGRCQLRGRGGAAFCCLGVLTDLAVQDGVCRWVPWDDHDVCGLPPINETSGVLDAPVLAWSGLSHCSPRLSREHAAPWTFQYLIELNDQGRLTFEQIADLIEADPEL